MWRMGPDTIGLTRYHRHRLFHCQLRVEAALSESWPLDKGGISRREFDMSLKLSSDRVCFEEMSGQSWNAVAVFGGIAR